MDDQKFALGQAVSIMGKLQAHKGKLTMAHPEIVPSTALKQDTGLVAVYPSSEKLKKGWIGQQWNGKAHSTSA